MLVKSFLKIFFRWVKKALEMPVAFRLQNFSLAVAYDLDFSCVRSDLTDPGNLDCMRQQKFFFIRSKEQFEILAAVEGKVVTLFRTKLFQDRRTDWQFIGTNFRPNAARIADVGKV